MKRHVLGLLTGILFLTACGGTSPVTQTTPIAIIEQATSTATQTPTPSSTPTASITPLPTIPTFTPTFDVSTIVTVTPVPKAECPKDNNSVKLDFDVKQGTANTIENILEYLNKGGSIKNILNSIPQDYYPNQIRFEDITGDKAPELVYVHYSDFISGGFYIFTCSNGKYTLFKNETVNWTISIYSVYDMNLNGIPELVIISRGCSGTGCYRHFIMEWDGSTYINLAPDAALEGVIDGKIIDNNNDGVLELILHTAPLPHYVYQPWREEVHIFSWDGETFAPQTGKGYQPQYRFQTIQDADLETTLESYDTALNLYRQAIIHDGLEWWSKERQTYENAVVQAPWIHEPTPSVKPQKDPTEYPRLATYAYYRIMLLQLVQNQESDATSTYNTLQQEFGNDPFGVPYVEMASVFWEAYQSTHNMYDGCAAAIQYAVEHPEILTPLGSDYDGSQSHIYVPEDVCPFR
jgi:hypothetical protein